MPINRTKDENGKFILEFDNGDARAFNQVKEKWGFVDDASLLRFAMAAMLSANDKTLSITTETGALKKVEPGVGYTDEAKK